MNTNLALQNTEKKEFIENVLSKTTNRNLDNLAKEVFATSKGW